uniref:small monomeric GTPase n=1 Tax=Nothobranchius furzeri TaxID=105023 RepID=A0A8C6M985_NOTFU
MAKADQRYGQRDGSDQNFDYMFKLLIIGNSSVGKTSFLFRYADDSFSNSFVSTVGIDFKVKTVYRNDKRIKMQIWDTAGQERYRTITTAYYRGAMGFILMYDITNEESFNAVQDWATQIKTYSWDNAQVIMVGNKCDMDQERVVPHEKGKHLADQLGEGVAQLFLISNQRGAFLFKVDGGHNSTPEDCLSFGSNQPLVLPLVFLGLMVFCSVFALILDLPFFRIPVDLIGY